MDRDRRDDPAVRRDEGHPAALPAVSRRTRYRVGREPDDALAQPRRRARFAPAHARIARARVCKGDPPSTIEAITINADEVEARKLQEQWQARGIDVPLVLLDSPYREVTRPLLDYIRSRRGQSPRDVVTVFIPEYVVGHWWEQLLHNQSALRLKARLLFEPGVMVTSVPWQLRSSARVHV